MAACLPCLLSLVLLDVAKGEPTVQAPLKARLPKPEELKEVTLALCTASDGSFRREFRPLPKEEELTWCLTLNTDKSAKPVPIAPAPYSRFGAAVYVTYSTLEQESQGVACQMKFDGYRGNYRVSPDFGSYAECQSVYAAQRHALAKNLPIDMPKAASDCPILDLPAVQASYRACRIPSNAWLHLHFRSRVTYQLRNHSRVERFFDDERLMSTHTSTRHDTSLKTRNYLTYLPTQSGSCFQSVLLAKAQSLPPDQMLRFKAQHSIIQDGKKRTRALGFHSLRRRPWVQIDFHLDRGNDTQQSLCLHGLSTEIGNSTVELSEKECFQLDLSTCAASQHSFTAMSSLAAAALVLTRLLS